MSDSKASAYMLLFIEPNNWSVQSPLFILIIIKRKSIHLAILISIPTIVYNYDELTNDVPIFGLNIVIRICTPLVKHIVFLLL